MKTADVVIACLSNNLVTKEEYVQKELRFALNIADEKPEGTLYIMPIRIDDCTVPLVFEFGIMLIIFRQSKETGLL